MRHLPLGVALLASAAATAAGMTTAELEPFQAGLDYHSFANTEQFRVTRLELDLRVDSTARILRGVVGMEIERLDPGATELILDTRDINVAGVSQKAQGVLGATSKAETVWVSRPFHFEKKDPILGQALVIELPPAKRPREFIRIEYETSPSAVALHWLTPKETHHGGFMYTESEPIGTRSWIPLQDTPQIRVTYKAIVHTTHDVVALMSAGNHPEAKHNGEYDFVMSEPIPPYLIALAVGDFAFQSTGSRTGVYADKAQLKAAVADFADAGAMLDAAERICGAYRWERFDLAVMPSLFLTGATGNPRLAFVSPTLLTGDKSEVGVVAAALATAWAGNLVVGSTWRDSWLSEGFSRYLESRIIGAVYGERRALIERERDLRSVHGGAQDDETLTVDLRDRDPVGAFAPARALKGRAFLVFLETRVGRERFDSFLRAYFDHFAFQSITTEQFAAYLRENLLDKYPGLVPASEVSAWLWEPGMPAAATVSESDAAAPVDAMRAIFTSGKLPAKKLMTHDWVAPQWLYFLDGMPSLSAAELADLDAAYGFSHSPNARIECSWFLLVIRNRYQAAYPRLEEYLMTTGRRQLIEPLYAAMMQTPAGAAQARRVYKLARSHYHPEVATLLDPLVAPPGENEMSHE